MNKTLKMQLVQAAKFRTSHEGSYCKYSHRDCMQNCIEGYSFCLRHILEDKTAPFKQCAYISKSGRRCATAALKQERKDGFCMEHGKKASLSRQRLNRKRRPRETTDGLLEELVNSSSGLNDHINGDQRRGKAHSDSLASKALEYASSSDSETEQPLVEHAWRDDGDSDAESIDSDQEDTLKYAGVYTTEEVAQILRDKLIRLQALYIDQFKRLRHVLLTKRQQYLKTYKAEKDNFGSIKLYKNDLNQREKYNKLCAMKKYHKKHGKEALLQKQSTERRMSATEGADYQPYSFPKCVFTDEGVRCCAQVVPLSKFCQKHILHDPGQVLYHPCPFADSQCGRPVPTLFNTEFCSLHQRLAELKSPDVCPLEVRVPEPESRVEHSAESSPALTTTRSAIKVEDLDDDDDEMEDIDLEMEPDDLHLFQRNLKEEATPITDDEDDDVLTKSVGTSGILFTLGEEEEDEEDGVVR